MRVAALAVLAMLAGSQFPASASVRNVELHGSTRQIAKVRTVDSAKSLVYLLSCMAFASQDLFKQALVACNHAVDLDPRDAEALSVRGSVLRELGERDLAIIDFSQAIERRPDDVAGYVLRGRTYFEAHRSLEALADFDRAVSLAPSDADAVAARGSVYKQMRRYREAIGDFDRAIALAPDEAAFWNARCWVRVISNTALRAALADCRNALDRDPTSVHALDSLGWVLFRMEYFERARLAFGQALAKSPRLASSWYGRGLSDLALGDLRSAKFALKKANALEPGIGQRFRGYGILPPPRPIEPRRRPGVDNAS